MYLNRKADVMHLIKVNQARLHTLFLILLFSLFINDTSCSFADSKRPDKGSITFGAKENPSKGAADEIGSFKTVFADVAEKVVPTVVSVIPTKIDTIVFYKNPFYHFFGDPFFNDDPFNFFFGNPRRGERRRQEPPVQKQERRQQGLGSGVIVSQDGYILTNFHVVSGADEINVKLNDGREFEAEIIGSDSLSDVAVLQIKGDVDDLPVAYLGDSDKLRPGDWTIAIGNPFSLTSTVTVGIVSALGRNISGGLAYQNFIQTDAAINPGNSGGALVNIEGELIGINTMIYTRSGGYMGIGFAIPVNMARRIMEDLIYKGEVVRGWIGVTIQDVDPATRNALDLKDRKGVLVGDVFEDQPADKAGIKPGDIILSIDGKEVATANQLRNVVASIQPGEKVPVVIFRNGQEKKLKLTVRVRDEGKIQKLSKADDTDIPEKKKEKMHKKLGIKVANVTAEMRQKYGINRKTVGVVVTEVDPKYHDARRALKEGDVIQRIKVSGSNFVSVSNTKEFEQATRHLKEGDSVMFLIKRNGNNFFVAFKIKK